MYANLLMNKCIEVAYQEGKAVELFGVELLKWKG